MSGALASEVHGLRLFGDPLENKAGQPARCPGRGPEAMSYLMGEKCE